MVAAKLDQSRVLVTKFRQNRLTSKGRSAGHTHTQTNSAEIRALQVCNRANSFHYHVHVQLCISGNYRQVLSVLTVT